MLALGGGTLAVHSASRLAKVKAFPHYSAEVHCRVSPVNADCSRFDPKRDIVLRSPVSSDILEKLDAKGSCDVLVQSNDGKQSSNLLSGFDAETRAQNAPLIAKVAATEAFDKANYTDPSQVALWKFALLNPLFDLAYGVVMVIASVAIGLAGYVNRPNHRISRLDRWLGIGQA